MHSASWACSSWRHVWRCRGAPASRSSSPACPAQPTPSSRPGSYRQDPEAAAAGPPQGACPARAHMCKLVTVTLLCFAAAASVCGHAALSCSPLDHLLQGDVSLLGALAAEVLLPGLRVGLPEDLAVQPSGAVPGSAAKAVSPAGERAACSSLCGARQCGVRQCGVVPHAPWTLPWMVWLPWGSSNPPACQRPTQASRLRTRTPTCPQCRPLQSARAPSAA